MAFEVNNDAMLASRFWLTGDLGKVQSAYAEARRVNQAGNAEAQGVEVRGQREKVTSADSGLALLSREGGDTRFREVLGRARALGQRTVDDAEVTRTARLLGLDLDRLVDDLAMMSLRRDPKLRKHGIPPARRDAEVAAARSVLAALLSSDEIRTRVLANRNLSRGGVLALLNGGLGCLKLIHDGQATADSIFELVRGDVYDITRPADVLKLSVKTAQKAREMFIDAASVQAHVDALKQKIAGDPALTDGQKRRILAQVEQLGRSIVAKREVLAASLNVGFNLGDGSKKSLEGQIRNIRERMRAFRYDLDRITGTEMVWQERIRRRMDNWGARRQTLTRQDFGAVQADEDRLNDLLRHFGVEDEANQPRRLVASLDVGHVRAATDITHMANNRIRYYFSGKEQRLEAFRLKAHKVLDGLVAKGGSRMLQFEVGADAKFTADIGFAEADCKAGAAYRYTVKVSVAPGGGEITVTTTHAGRAAADGKAEFGHNDGDKAETWDAEARKKSWIAGFSADVKGSVELSRTRTVKYRDLEDFIAALGGESSLVTRSPSRTMACLGKIGGFFRMVGRATGHGLVALATKAKVRIAKTREDNAAYVNKMRALGVLDGVDHLVAHRDNVVRTQNGTSWAFSVMGGLGGSANFGAFNDTKMVPDPDTGVKEERVEKAIHLEVGAHVDGTVERTFARKATDYRTHLETARSHSLDWLRGCVGAWYEGLPVEGGAAHGRAALRDIERRLQAAEDEIAANPNKDLLAWSRFADQLGVLALELAYLEKLPENAELDTRAFADRLVSPHVAIPEDIYEQVLQDVSNVTRNGQIRTTVNVSVNWAAGSSLLDKVEDWASDGPKAADSSWTGGWVDDHVSDNVMKGLGKGFGGQVSGLGGNLASTIAPTECTVKGTWTRTSPVAKDSVCPWSNATTHELSIGLTPGLTTRAIIEILARKFVDSDTTIKPEDRPNVFKQACEDYKGALEEALGLSALSNVWETSVAELAKRSPKLAALLGAPLTGAGTGLDAEVDTDYYKRMTFTLVKGRLVAISTDDFTQVGSSIGGRGLKEGVSFGVHMKELLTTVEVDRASLVRPSIDTLMGQAEPFLRMGDREGLKGLLAHNTPGALRLFRAIVDPNAQPAPDPRFVADGQAFQARRDEAKRVLEHIRDGQVAGSVGRDRADKLLAELDAIRNRLDALHAGPAENAQKVDAMADLVWALTDTYRFAQEVGGFTRDAEGAVQLPENARMARLESWTSNVNVG